MFNDYIDLSKLNYIKQKQDLTIFKKQNREIQTYFFDETSLDV